MSAQPSSSADAALSKEGGILRVLPPVGQDDESRLIALAKSGDRRAMHNLLAPWNDRIFSFLVTMLRNRQDAEDAAQETFLRVVKGLANYEHSGRFQAWIFRIARNQAALTGMRRTRLEKRESKVEDSELREFAAPTETTDADEAAQLRAAIETLPAAEREVVRLRLDEDLKFREIAERTGAPLNTVLGRMRNALRRLHEQLTQSSIL